jgi:hypothetical protein
LKIRKLLKTKNHGFEGATSKITSRL